MKNIIFFLVVTVLWSGSVRAGDFSLHSPQLGPGKTLMLQQVGSGSGCTGSNLSPALNWSDAPANTKSFAITVYDPDSPTGSGWWHWVIFNIPGSENGVVENAGNPDTGLAPKGSVQSRTDFGVPGYGGACPPPGAKPHRYQFKVYALDVESLPLGADSTAAMVGYLLHMHSLGIASIEAVYGR